MVNVPQSSVPITDKVVQPVWYRFFNELNRAKLEASLVSTFMLTVLDDTTATAALATLGIVASTYTPTLTSSTNVAASTAYVCLYIRVGNNVYVFGRVDIDPTSAVPTTTILGISLPVASNFSLTTQAHGVGTSAAVSGQHGGITSDATSDIAVYTCQAVNTANSTHFLAFGYLVI